MSVPADLRKKVSKMLNSGVVLCAYRAGDGTVYATVKDSKKGILRLEISKDAQGVERAVCSCGETGDPLCMHAMAVLVYLEENSKPREAVKELPPKFAGLKFQGLPELLSETVNPPKAYLKLNADSEFPHVPSKWEKTLLSVTVVCGAREYKGNLSNLRQLHFDKGMAAAVHIAHFSLQERQIIRFLAINAESDGPRLTLDAEQTAEFFHCLINYDNFSRNGKKLLVHQETAEPLLLCYDGFPKYKLRTAISIEGAFLPLDSPSVITGRVGCWVGIKGEYWWIPAREDVGWLRSFLRTTAQDCDRNSAEFLISGKSFLPCQVVKAEPVKIKEKHCRVLYDANFEPEEGKFLLDLVFDYEGAGVKPDGGSFGRSGTLFWKRESKFEREMLDELLGLGFKKNRCGSSSLTLSLPDFESAGIFLDKVLPEWFKEGRELYLSSRLATFCGGGQGMRRLNFECNIEDSTAEAFTLKYDFLAFDQSFSWQEIKNFVKSGRKCIRAEKGIVIVDDKLCRFVSAMSGVIEPVKGKTGMIKISRFMIPYWSEMGKSLPGAVPAEFYEINSGLKEIDSNISTEQHLPLAKGFEFKGKLRAYQSQAVDWLGRSSRKGFNLILADEMGLGKTIQTLALLASVSSKGGAPSLVLCPTSLVENWRREAHKFVPDFKVVAINGSKRKALWDKAKKAELVICSYALVKRDLDSLKATRFKFLILDEAQHIKNPSTANAKACKSLEAEHRLVLTGTPLENSPNDLWSIFDFLHPGMLGSFNHFKDYYAGIHESKDLQDDLACRVSPFMLRRKKKEVYKELPPKQEQVLYCEMDSRQRKLYDEFKDIGRRQCEMLLHDKTKKQSASCCDPSVLPAEMADELAGSAKMDLLKELMLEITDSDHKVLLFSQFTSILKIISDWLKEEKIPFEYLDGSTKNRMDRVDNFNNSSDIQIFLLSLKAGGSGLNLTSADTVILFDPWWNPAVEAQATDRTHRIGQLRTVNSIKLVVKDSIEERILALQDKKQLIFQSLVDNPAASMKQFDLKDIEFLLK
jgi:superfamily II DNA or RNA helicase